MMQRLLCAFSAAILLPLAAHAADPYPTELRRAFMERCVGLSKELVEPCRCVLGQVERSITPEEVQKQLAAGTLDKDPRFAAIARQCSGQSQQPRR